MTRTYPLTKYLSGLLLIASSMCVANYPTINRHMYVNGSGYISVPNSPSLNTTLSSGGTFTIDAWIYPTSFATYPTIVGNDYVNGYWLGLNTAGKLRFYPGGGQYRESNSAVPLNQWTHVAVSYNYAKAEARFFINNVLDATVFNFGFAIGLNSGDLRIGADRSGQSAAYFFSGYIDEVRIWNTEIDFPSTDGALYKIPQQFGGGAYGKFLVSAWRLNGDGADSVSNNNGTEVGGVAWQTTNHPAHYSRICANLRNFTGQTHDYFSVPHTSSISLTANYALECWVNLSNQQGGSTTYQTFISKGANGGNIFSYWLGVNKQSGKLRFVPNGNFASALESSDPLPTNQWVHVAGVFSWGGNLGTAKVFIDGVLKGSATFNSTAAPNQFPLLIGTSDQQLQPSAAYALVGKIDEVRLWNSTRTDAEIANAYRFEIDAGYASLVASYHFDGDVLDLSGMNNHGSNFNGSSFDLFFQDASDLPASPTLSLTAPNGGESWEIGSTHAITWSSSGLAWLKIELSRDGGSSYSETLVDPVPASAGSFNWLITGPPTSDARVRVSTSTITPASDESNDDFKIIEQPPMLTLSKKSFSFTAIKGEAPPPEQVLRLSNTGGGTLMWSASGYDAWLAVSPTFNTSNDDSTAISISNTNLPVGNYNTTITFNGNADNVPLTVSVLYTVLPPPHIDPLPPFVQFNTRPGVNPPDKSVKIRNASNGILNWSASSTAPWLTVAPSSGIQNDSIVLSIDVSGMSAATYNANVAVTGNADNSPTIIPVQLIISSIPTYPVTGLATKDSYGVPGVSIDVTGDSVFSTMTGSDGAFSIAGLPAGNYTFTPHSSFFDFSPSSQTLTPLNAPANIVFTARTKSGKAKLHYQKGWNLISLPIDPGSIDVASLSSHVEAPPIAYRYSQDSGYISETMIQFGIGYWVKFTQDDSVDVSGTLRGDFNSTLRTGATNWNLIGGLSGATPFASIIQSPASSIITIYQYNPGEGYRVVPGDLLIPGRGFFVKVSRDVSIRMYASFTGSIRDLQRAAMLPSTLPDILSLPQPPGE